jgi:hypothetical protein
LEVRLQELRVDVRDRKTDLYTVVQLASADGILPRNVYWIMYK